MNGQSIVAIEQLAMVRFPGLRTHPRRTVMTDFHQFPGRPFSIAAGIDVMFGTVRVCRHRIALRPESEL